MVKVLTLYLLETWKEFPQLQLMLLEATVPLHVADTLSFRLSMAKHELLMRSKDALGVPSDGETKQGLHF